MSEREWRCFHCDELFTDVNAAAEHFGVEIQDVAACRQVNEEDKALLKIIADQAKQLSEYRNESTPADKIYYALKGEVSKQAIASEELGYRRGLEDGRRDWWKILVWRLQAKWSL